MSLDLLHSHPLEVASKYPFNIEVRCTAPTLVGGAENIGGLYGQTHKVDRGQRVQSVSIRLDGTGIIDVTISNPGAGPGEPCYWLPYVDDQITRTKLPDGGTGRPRFFFTAQLNGCSVFIETTAGRTHVYHANAKKAGTYHGTEKGHFYDPTFAQVRDIKAEVMRDGFGQMRKGTGQHVETNAGDYFKSPLFTPTKPFDKSMRRVVYQNANVGRTLLKKGVYVRNIEFNTAFAVVFGVWKSGGWQFYQQSVVELNYQHRSHFYGTWANRYGANFVESCTRLF